MEGPPPGEPWVGVGVEGSRLWLDGEGGSCPVYQGFVSARRRISFISFPSRVCLLWECSLLLTLSGDHRGWVNEWEFKLATANCSQMSLMGKRRGPWATREAQKLFLIGEQAQSLEKLVNKYVQIHIMCSVWWYFIYINLSSSCNKPKW